MTWHWKNVDACDLDEMADDINPQMKSLEGELGKGRPPVMAGQPSHVGAIVSNTTVTAPTDTVENTLKSTFLPRNTLSPKGGWRLTASGECSGVSSKTLKVYWGGIEIGSIDVASAERAWLVDVTGWNQEVTNKQVITVRMVEFPEVGTTNLSREETATVSIQDVETA